MAAAGTAGGREAHASMPSEHVRFPGGFGDELAARLDLPEGRALGWALFAHCFTCGKDLRAAGWISRTLAEHGIGVLRFDFTGVGDSDGDFAATTFTSNLEDVRAAIRYLIASGRPPGLLVGHSLGGAAVLAVGGEFSEVRAVASIAAPGETAHFKEKLLAAVPQLAWQEEAEITLGGRRWRIRRELIDDLNRHPLPERLATLGKPLLVLHSPADRTVAIAEAERIVTAARQPKSLVSLDRADHLLMADERDARWVGHLLAAWAWRYLVA